MEDLRAKLDLAHIPALDGLRAIAAFLVILYHFAVGRAWGHWGNLGVEVFFVLSGFLITWLLLREQERHGRIAMRHFYIRRGLRIFPAFYCYWLLCVALFLFTGQPVPWGHALSAFFYVSNYYLGLGSPEGTPLLGHTWSLAVEEHFYLLWPLVFARYGRDLKQLTRVLMGVIGAVWVYRAALVLLWRVPAPYLYCAADTRADQLLVGCVLAAVLKRGLVPACWQLLCSRLYLPALPILLLGASSYLQVNHNYTYLYVVGFALDPILVAVLIVQVITLSSHPLWGWLNWGVVRYLGRISYSLYLYHALLTPAPVQSFFSSTLPWCQLAARMATTVLLASGSFFVVEQPCLKLKKHFT